MGSTPGTASRKGVAHVKARIGAAVVTDECIAGWYRRNRSRPRMGSVAKLEKIERGAHDLDIFLLLRVIW